MKELPSCAFLHGFSQKWSQEEKLTEAVREGDDKPPQGQVTVSQHFPSTSVKEKDILVTTTRHFPDLGPFLPTDNPV